MVDAGCEKLMPASFVRGSEDTENILFKLKIVLILTIAGQKALPLSPLFGIMST